MRTRFSKKSKDGRQSPTKTNASSISTSKQTSETKKKEEEEKGPRPELNPKF